MSVLQIERKNRIKKIMNTIEKVKKVDIDDLYGEFAMFGLSRRTFLEYVNCMVLGKHVKRVGGELVWVG